MLDYIYLFVAILDKYFGSVCELDIVYNFYKVYNILDDLVAAGEVIEASRELIVKKQRQLELYD